MLRDPAVRRCYDLIEAFSPGGSPQPTSIEATGPNECRFRNFRLSATGLVGYHVDTLLVRGFPFDDSSAPVHARVEARGLTLDIQNGSATLVWMSHQQQVPFDLTLDASYDSAASALVLDDFSMDGELLGHFGLRARLENVHFNTARADIFPDLQELPSFKSFHAELDSRTFQSSFIVPSIANLLPEDDPDGAYQAGRTEVIKALKALLPASGASADTIEALVSLVTDFPHPKHPATLDVTAATPIPPDDIVAATDDPARLPALLRTLTIAATYAGPIR